MFTCSSMLHRVHVHNFGCVIMLCFRQLQLLMSKMSLKAYFPNLAETFQKANKGDIGALKLLNLDPGEHSTRLTKLAKIKKDTLKKDALKKEIASTIFEMEAAAQLGMSNIQLLYQIDRPT